MDTDFNLLTTRSNLEVIEDAIVEALLFDSETSSFCPWVRLAEPDTWPDIPPPYGAVTVSFAEGEFKLSLEEEIRANAEITLVYDEMRDIVDPGDKTIKSLVEAVLRVLGEERNSHLSAGIEPVVVDRLSKFLGITYASIIRSSGNVEEGEDEVISSSALIIGIEYIYTINRARLKV